MRTLWQNNSFITMVGIILFLLSAPVFAETFSHSSSPIDRVQLVTKEIALLKNRYGQDQQDLITLQKQHDTQFNQIALGHASKRLLDKASLEIAVDQSKQESVEIEIGDAQQSITWLEKNIQEIQNQLNLLGMFGLKVAKNELVDVQELKNDLIYKQKLLGLEKERLKYLREIQMVEISTLQLKKQSQDRLSTILKSNQLLNIKEKQVEDELVYQELQHSLLGKLAVSRDKLLKLDPVSHSAEYLALERNIYITNERANYAYTLSLVARYRDQIQQMQIAALRGSNSVSLLSQIIDQVNTLSKQVSRLDSVVKSRSDTLRAHIKYLTRKRSINESTQVYITSLSRLLEEYQHSVVTLDDLKTNLVEFRASLEKSLQVELSSRQGFPSFGFKTMLDLGKEMLLVPPLTFHIAISLSANLLKGVQDTSILGWFMFVLAQSLLIYSFTEIRKLVRVALNSPSDWREKVNSKWLTLQWLNHNFIELALIGNLIGIMYYFHVPIQNYSFMISLACVWVVFKSILTLARVCLVETTHDTVSGHDFRVYKRLKWLIVVGGIITALTVFLHQLPLIYELKTLCDRLFLFFLMLVSLLLLRSWDVLPNLILSRIDGGHPYLQKSIRLIGFIIPLLFFANSLVGVFGYVNLVMTISSYEGIFLIVLIVYLILRGLLSDAIEQLSKLLIQHSNNGWLWSEAFLKPFDNVLRVALFFLSCAVLFLLYGWDKQSTIVVRFTGLLHYKMFNMLNTDITPLGVIELLAVIAVFYWSAKWSRELVYRVLRFRMRDIGLRNSIAILTQYTVVLVGLFICFKVLGVDLKALTWIATALAFGVGLGLRDLVNNFASGFLLLLERPLRVGDIVEVNGVEGEVVNIGSRAITVRNWNNMDMVVPNTEIFNKIFTNLTYKDSVVRCLQYIKISRHDDPHAVSHIIQTVLNQSADILKDPAPEVLMKTMTEFYMEFELRFYVNVRMVSSRVAVGSAVLMRVWDEFGKSGIKPPYPQQEIFINESNEWRPNRLLT